jgi:hypothetical protein
MRVVAIFDPPMAMSQLNVWREQHEEALAPIPHEAIRIDVGRTHDGDFARVRVEDAYADRFDESDQGV